MATLYIVATPIGNLEDITHRALRVLREVSVVLCEDTRTTSKLLGHYAIETPTLSYHAHSGDMKIDKIIELLEEGKDVALVTDAGTPAISDPGSFLVSRVRTHFSNTPERIAIVAIPGPSALTAALSIAGVPTADFLFLGFLPHKKGRETLFREIADATRTVVFYESPHRIEKTLDSLAEHLGAGTERRVTLVRELTKIYEEVLTGTPQELSAILLDTPEKRRGEFVVIVSA